MVNTWWSRRRLETPGCSLRAWISVDEWYWGWSHRMPWKGMESASKVGRKKWKWSNIGNASKCFSRDRKERRRPKTTWCVISSCDGNLLYQVYLDLFTFMTKKLNTYTGKDLRTKVLVALSRRLQFRCRSRHEQFLSYKLCILQVFPALRKAITTHAKKYRIFSRVFDIASQLLTRLSRHLARLMNARRSLHHCQPRSFVRIFSDNGC